MALSKSGPNHSPNTALDIDTHCQEQTRLAEDGLSTSESSTAAIYFRQSDQDAHVRAEEGRLFLKDHTESSLDEFRTHNANQSVVTSMPGCKADWLPLTLRLPYLSFLISISLALATVVAVLTVLSAQHEGLGSDRNSPALFFGWRFSPTLIATIYALLVASMLNDVRRTEIFARLSKPGGAAAAHTLCSPSRSWWHDPFDAMNKTKNNGFRSLALLSASFANIMVLLVISPLSSGLLSPINATISKATSFEKAVLAPDITWQSGNFNPVIFRTIAGAILNQTTSAWINPEFAILPFWPSGTNLPTGSDFVDQFSSQQWKSPTIVYKAELDCVPLHLTNWSAYTVYIKNRGMSIDVTTTVFSSSDGCNITIVQDGQSLSGYHGGWVSSNPQSTDSFLGQFGSWKSSRECGNRSSIILKKSFGDELATMGNICTPKFFSAAVNATVDITDSKTAITFDNDEYTSNRQQLNSVQYDIPHLEDIFLNSNWSSKFFRSVTWVQPEYAGPILAVAASPDYNGNIDAIFNDPNFIKRASMLHQQYFGEMLLLALDTTSEVILGPSQVIVQERRIVVVSSIAVALVVLLILSSICVAAVTYATRLGHRDLQLLYDPGSITAIASLIARDHDARIQFEDTDRASSEELVQLLGKRRFAIEHGHLLLAGNTEIPAQCDQSSSETFIAKKHPLSEPRPIMIRIWMGALLLAVLTALIASLIILCNLSRKGSLHQAFLINQLNVDILKLSAVLTPYSIVPTLIAVGVKLWFSASAETFKRLQPFVSIVESPESASNSVLAEYANTPIALVTVKAVKHSHWILALIGAGALMTEAFTVGMSALWDREIRTTKHSFILSRQLELRRTPQIFHHSRAHTSLSAGEAVLDSIFDTSLQNWLYGAAIELTQSASTPPWSKDTWSFVPLNGSVTHEALSLPNSIARNMTVQTPALRARLECKVVDYASDTAAWLGEADFTNETLWNVTNSPQGLDAGYYLEGSASHGPGQRTIACCAKDTPAGPGEAVVGYWTKNDSSANIPLMQVKWVYGRPLNGLYTQWGEHYERFIWSEPPQIAAISCTPIIEKAEASILVNYETGIVHDYEIVSPLENATEAWSDFYFYHGADTGFEAHWQENITTSWGYIFWDSLLTAANAGDLVMNKLFYGGPEDTADGIFNIRGSGLNTDFMSYSMLALANDSKQALLDPDTLFEYANKTFGTFFKHFASEEVNSNTGGRVYQLIGERLPADLGPVMYSSNISDDQGALASQDNAIVTPKETEAILLVPVEQLIMSPIAVYLSISLLAVLVLTTIVMYSVNRSHYKKLPRDVDTLASMIAFVYGSEKLHAWSQDMQHSGAWYRFRSTKSQHTANKEVQAHMGTFHDRSGKERWGIELVDMGDSHPKPQHHDSEDPEEAENEGSNGNAQDSDARIALLDERVRETQDRQSMIHQEPMPAHASGPDLQPRSGSVSVRST